MYGQGPPIWPPAHSEPESEFMLTEAWSFQEWSFVYTPCLAPGPKCQETAPKLKNSRGLISLCKKLVVSVILLSCRGFYVLGLKSLDSPTPVRIIRALHSNTTWGSVMSKHNKKIYIFDTCKVQQRCQMKHYVQLFKEVSLKTKDWNSPVFRVRHIWQFSYTVNISNYTPATFSYIW